jgi:hypothetical protein
MSAWQVGEPPALPGNSRGEVRTPRILSNARAVSALDEEYLFWVVVLTLQDKFSRFWLWP